jgi:ATP-dependent helicase/DNAse subunit B
MNYFLTYVLGFQSPSGKRAQMGTVVHKVMECLAACKKELQDSDKKRLSVNDDAIGEIKFTPKNLYEDKIVSDLLKRSYDHYTSKCEHSYTKADFKFCDDLVKTCLTYNNGQFDPRNRNILCPEASFDLPIEEPWANFEYTDKEGQLIKGQLAIKGTIDLVTKIEDDMIEVIDWKSGQRKNWATGEVKTYDKLMDDAQLLLYNYAITKVFPDYKQSIMTIFFIRDGGPFSMCFDKADQEKFLKKLENRFYEIQNNENPKPLSPNRSDFRCTRLCYFHKNNWPGTNQTMCRYVENKIKTEGYDKTVEDCTKPGFDMNFYSAPG